MIETKDLYVAFNADTPLETKALRGVNLTIKAGEFVTVIGSNGAGKSTILNALAVDIPAEQGDIIIDQQSMTKWDAPKRGTLVSRVFQDPMAGSCESLSVEENMALASQRGSRRGLLPALSAELRVEFPEKLQRLELGLESRLQDKMGLLSGGQRQAVSLVMATLRPASLLLLDEHTAAQDPRIAAIVMKLTAELVQEMQLTALMVTHSMRRALDYGTRTIMLHEGQIVFDVSGEERAKLDVADLIKLFASVRGEELDDDKLLLG
jgi:putative ABC transport system ATP-binding protein